MIKLIVGLGNPGTQYIKTRHNAGFWLLDRLATQVKTTWKEEKKFCGYYSKISLAGCPIHLVKPQTYMNHSGLSLAAVSRFFDIAPEEILIVHDELDLPTGTAKLKYGGGHGGHNGLRDIIKAIDSKDFYRLRIGIGHPGIRHLVVDYVLKPPSKAEQLLIDGALQRAENILPILIHDGAEKAMYQLHSQ